MKKHLFLTAMIALLAAFSISAQEKTADFSGKWELDVSKSKLDERARIESMTMNVAQTEKEIKIETVTKRAENNDGDGNRRGGGMMGGGGNGMMTYTLDGKETKVQQDSPMGQIPVTLKGKIEESKLKLSQTRTFNTQMGEMTITTKETWSLSDEGETLTVKRETQTPRGNQSSELVFTKYPVSVSGNVNVASPTQMPRTVSGGVLNGKAKTLVKPTYPADAKAAKASGAVNVQVTIDEQGNVISAKAVSGDILLRAVSEEAARASKFNPTMLGGVPVMVTGVIVYNFVQ
ncbi:hypothetical protein BH10ACI1_BH10ACI1_08690 [soil metagenome]